MKWAWRKMEALQVSSSQTFGFATASQFRKLFKPVSNIALNLNSEEKKKKRNEGNSMTSGPN